MRYEKKRGVLLDMLNGCAYTRTGSFPFLFLRGPAGLAFPEDDKHLPSSLHSSGVAGASWSKSDRQNRAAVEPWDFSSSYNAGSPAKGNSGSAIQDRPLILHTFTPSQPGRPAVLPCVPCHSTMLPRSLNKTAPALSRMKLENPVSCLTLIMARVARL